MQFVPFLLRFFVYSGIWGLLVWFEVCVCVNAIGVCDSASSRSPLVSQSLCLACRSWAVAAAAPAASRRFSLSFLQSLSLSRRYGPIPRTSAKVSKGDRDSAPTSYVSPSFSSFSAASSVHISSLSVVGDGECVRLLRRRHLSCYLRNGQLWKYVWS